MHGKCAPFLRHLPLPHERVPHLAGLAPKLDEPAMVNDAVYNRGRHLVVNEHRPPAGELQVGCVLSIAGFGIPHQFFSPVTT